MRTRFWLTLLPALTALLLLPVAASALSYDQTVDKLIADGYPQAIETYLTSQGTSSIGMAFGGSSADTARAEYLASKLRALGFKVALESVPLDVMEFKGASVTVGGDTFVASTFGGVRGTPPGGSPASSPLWAVARQWRWPPLAISRARSRSSMPSSAPTG
jgi:ABC-type transport system substrate-binding protein